MSVSLVGCVGGKGEGGGSDSNGGYSGFGSFLADTSVDVGEVCMGYTMTASSCSSIGGTWNSSAVPAKYTCQGHGWNATSGDCHIKGMKFTAVNNPLSVEAISKCNEFGGQITPKTQVDCENESGTWVETAAASTSYACNRAPSDLTECDAVGGKFKHYRSIEGRISPSNEGFDKGKAFLFVNSADLAADFLSNATIIESLSGEVVLRGMVDTLWTAPAPVTKASNFKTKMINGNEETLVFDVKFSQEYSSEDSSNGVGMELLLYYHN